MLKLEVGKKYRTKDGKTVLIRQEVPDYKVFRFAGHHVDGPIANGTWMEDGRYSFDASSPNHLVEEVPGTQAPETQKPLKLEVGKRYKTRDGRITTPLEGCDDEEFCFTADVPRTPRVTWTETGRWGLIPAYVSQLDLIEEYIEPTRDPVGSEQPHVFFGDLTDKKSFVLKDTKGKTYTYTRVAETEKPTFQHGDIVICKKGRLHIVEWVAGCYRRRAFKSLVELSLIQGGETQVTVGPVNESHLGKTVYYRDKPYTLESILNHASQLSQVAMIGDDSGAYYARLNELLFAEPV